MASRWGDLPGSPSQSMSVVPVEVELPFVQPQPVDIEGPRIHQPSQQQKMSSTPLPAELCRQDVISINTIQLLKHNRRVRSMIALAQQHHHDNKADDKDHTRLPTLPVIPPQSKNTRSWDNETTQLGTIELDDATVRQLTRKAVATICAHSGFENCQESVLETLTDVLRDHSQKICQLLRVAVDREAMMGSTPFQDVLQGVFHEIGISSFRNLQLFWETRIRNYHKLVHTRALQLRQEYEKYRNPKRNSDDNGTVRIKEEPLSEIQFPLGDAESQEASEHLLDLHAINALELEESSCSSNVTENESPHWSLTYIKSETQDRVSALDSLSESITVDQQDYTAQVQNEGETKTETTNAESLSSPMVEG